MCSNSSRKVGSFQIIMQFFPDHYAILVKPLTQSCSISTKSIVFKHKIRESSLANFGKWISRMNWNIVYRLNNPNEKYSLFYHLLSSAIDEYFPLKKSKRSSLDKLWLTSELKDKRPFVPMASPLPNTKISEIKSSLWSEMLKWNISTPTSRTLKMAIPPSGGEEPNN